MDLLSESAKFLQIKSLGYQSILVPLNFTAGSSHKINIKLALADRTFQAELKAEYYTVEFVSGSDNNLPKGTIRLTPLKEKGGRVLTLEPFKE